MVLEEALMAVSSPISAWVFECVITVLSVAMMAFSVWLSFN